MAASWSCRPGVGGGRGCQHRQWSLGRFPDGVDTDTLCTDFLTQPATTMPAASAAGATNIKFASVAGFAPARRY